MDNPEWLGSADLIGFLRDVGKLFSVNEMVRKDSVRARLEEREQSLSFTEFSYMLLQSWDFLELHDRYHCELQLGGSDQWGNITEGVDLIRRRRGTQAFGLTSPLVTKADGTKFGKTESGNVWLDPVRTTPYTFFQFWLRTDDSEVGPYLRRFTFPRPGADRGARAGHRRPSRAAGGPAGPGSRDDRPRARRGRGPPGPGRGGGALHRADRLARPADAGAGAGRRPVDGRVACRPRRGTRCRRGARASGLAKSNGDARRLLADGAVYLNGHRLAEERPLGVGDALHGRWIVLRRGLGDQHVLVVTSSA